jgi:hypothetical protein
MREETIERIRVSTGDLPVRWREVLEKALLHGEFENEAERLLRSSLSIHERHSPEMETAESILAGDAYIPMAVKTLVEDGISLEEIKAVLSKAASRLPN